MTATTRRILIAGIGNIFLGDDAFGVETIAELLKRTLPAELAIRDFGIRGLDLAYALTDGYDAVILVDAAPRGGVPGQLYVIEPDLSAIEANQADEAVIETHGMNPVRVLQMVRTLGGDLKRILVVGCEPSPVDDSEEMQPGLSDAVRNSVMPAADLILKVAAELMEEVTATTQSVVLEG